MFCLSKGLGAPVGSMLLGSRALIDAARSWRKLLGGGMRQAGVIAAAGLIALEEGPKRLHEDHENARRFANGLAEIDGIGIELKKVVTNIVIFEVVGTGLAPGEITARLAKLGVLATVFGASIRIVTHCDISTADIDLALDALRKVLK
jgi:threonine aldolase